MSLNPKTIYIAQRTPDGLSWEESYVSGSNLILQTDGTGSLIGVSTSSLENLHLVYPPSDLAVSGHIAVWANSMGIVGSAMPWPSWLAIRSGRVVYNFSVAGETSTEIKSRFDASPATRGCFTIFDVARNDVSFTTTKSNLSAMISALGHDRYLVIGVLCRQSTPIGNAQHTLDLALNAELLALYGEKFYDPQSYLVDLWDPNSAQDVTDHGNDVFPTSFEYNNDETHLNSAGHIAQADVITPLVLHSIPRTSPSFTENISITKSAPTLTLTNTGVGSGSFALATTDAAGQFRITEVGVADRLVISKMTGNIGVGTTSPYAPFVVSNGGQLGLEIDPTISSGTQINVLAYNRVTSAYKPIVLAASAYNFTTGDVKFNNAVTASGNLIVTKSAPTIYLANTGVGGKTFRLSTTAVSGDFRITEDGVADRLTILPTTGYVGIGTTTPVAPFSISNGGSLGLEIDPTVASGTQINVLAYNRVTSAYKPIVLAASAYNFTVGDFTLTKSAPTLTLTNTDTGSGSFALSTTAAGGQFRITEVGLADRFVINKTTGRIGIGTATPQSQLVISSGSALGLEIDPNNAGGTQVGIISFNRATSTYKPIVFGASGYTFQNGSVQFDGTASATSPTVGAVTIGNGTSATNVAIGGGNIYAGGSGTFNSVTASIIKVSTLIIETVTASIVYSTGSNRFGSADTDTQTFTGSVLMRGNLLVSSSIGVGTSTPLYRFDVSGSYPFRAYSPSGNGIILNPSYNYYDAYNHIFRTLGGVSTSMTIDNLGKVGIGTITPQCSLDIAKDFTYNNYTTAALRLSSISSSSRYIVAGYDNTLNSGVIQSTEQGIGQTSLLLNPNGGKIGIGTTTPTARLTVVDTGNSFPLLVIGNNQPNGVAIGTGGTGVPSINGYSSSFGATADLAIQPNGGRVGIGTTTPNRILTIQGETGVTPLLELRTSDYSLNTAGSGFYIGPAVSSGDTYTRLQAYKTGNSAVSILTLNPDGGNVGIGTSTPTQTLDVNGNANITGVLTASQLALNPISNSPYAQSAWIKNTGNYGTYFVNSGITKWAGFNGSDFVVSDNLIVGATASFGSGINIAGTTSATSPTVGAVTIGNGTSATNVAIGGGNIYAGSLITGTGTATASAAIRMDNSTGGSGTAQHYANLTSGVTTIARFLRGNGAANYEGNGLNIDNYAGMQIGLNALGGSGGSFNVIGGDVTVTSAVNGSVNIISTDAGTGAPFLRIGYNSNLSGQLTNDAATGKVYLDSRYNDVSSGVVIRTKASGTPVTCATFDSSGNTTLNGTLEVHGPAGSTTYVFADSTAGTNPALFSARVVGPYTTHFGTSAATDNVVTGTVVGDGVIRTTRSLLISTNDGTSAALKISSSGVIGISKNLSLGTSTFANSLSGVAGEISLDNGSTDSPGIHFYTGNNTNYGIDAASGNFRVVKNLDESGGTVLVTVGPTGATTFNCTTSATSPTAGAVLIGDGTSATNVAIGGGNINAGGTLTTAGQIKNNYLGLVNDSLNQHFTNATADVAVNYLGYNGGTTQFRNLRVYDGKSALAFEILGSTKAATFAGDLTVSGTSNSFAGVTQFTRTGMNGVGAASVIGMATDARTAGDALSLGFVMQDSGAATQNYGSITVNITDPTAASEDSTMVFNTVLAGATATALTLTGDGAAVAGNVTVGGVTILKNYTVATLPAAASYPYGTAFVSDATNAAGTGLGTSPTGGGSVKRCVYCDGSNWLLM